MDLHLLSRALDVVEKEIDPTVQVSTLRVLLAVSIRGSCTQKDIEVELQMTNASTSRNISYWTERRADRKPGLNFISRFDHPHDRRLKMLTLTTKGKHFIDKLAKAGHGQAKR